MLSRFSCCTVIRPTAWISCENQLIRRSAACKHPKGARDQASHFLCDKLWLLPKDKYGSQVVELAVSSGVNICLVRDDLLHPYLGGNKLRKLDGLLPEIKSSRATHVVTCGGVQSAHAAAVAAVCAEQGLKCHLLVRGERPSVVTGYHLLTRMFGEVQYVSRNVYADRQAMFEWYLRQLQDSGIKGDQVAVIEEGGAHAAALLGFIRMVEDMVQQRRLCPDTPYHIIVDSGTGTTALGVALGCMLCGVPWRVLGVMLAGSMDDYTAHTAALLQKFDNQYGGAISVPQLCDLPLSWVERCKPRKFGKVFETDVAQCRMVAQQHGVLLDPIYSLAGWEAAVSRAQSGVPVVYLHSGGALGLFGLSSRHPDWF